MSMSKTTNTYNRQNWEDADFPILCQTCLGDNPYIRMTKEKFGKECKICKRPFTVFRWCPGARSRFKKTEVCQTCAKIKNVCQTCLLDLEYGLPTQVRDVALNMAEELPKSDVNKEYYIQNVEKQLASTTEGALAVGALGKTKAQSEMLLRLARTTPYYKRNRPHICSFWVKGECKRGEECPYRHERPTDPDDPLADQNIKDRYYGVNDPVADKLLKRAATMPELEPPEDKSITTIYVGNLGERIGEAELRSHFFQYGDIRHINVVSKQQYAFIQFVTRAAAEIAAEKCYNKLILQNRRLNIKWGRSQGRQGMEGEEEPTGKVFSQPLEPVPGLPKLPPPPEELQNNYFNLSSAAASIPLPPGQGPDSQPPEAVTIDNVHPSHPGLPRLPMPPQSRLPIRAPPIGLAPFPPRAPPGVPPGAPHRHIQPPPFLPPHVRPVLRHPGDMRPPRGFFPRPPPVPGIGHPIANVGGVIHYPSQDPTQMGASTDNK